MTTKHVHTRAAALLLAAALIGASAGTKAAGATLQRASAHRPDALTALLAGARAAPALLTATYAGPPGSQGTGVAVDRAGDIYVVGTAGVPPSSRAWVTKYDPSGTHVLYTVTIGAPCGALGSAIAVDAAGNAYMTGQYGARNQYNLCQLLTDVLVARIDPRGHLLYQRMIGPSARDAASIAIAVTNVGNAIAVDHAGNAYVTGRTDADASLGVPGVPTTPGALQSTSHLHDGFVLKLDPSGATVYSTFLGGHHGNIIDQGNGIAVDAAGDAYVTGTTQSSDFPTTQGAVQRHPGARYGITARSNAFLAELDPTGSRLLYGTYLGGGVAEEGTAVAVDSAGNVYLTGATDSPNFPVTPNAYDRTCGTDGNCNVVFVTGVLRGDIYADDAFVAKLVPGRAGRAALAYATFLGGRNLDQGRAIAVDRLGHVWVAGFTASRDGFPTLDAVQPTLAGGKDAFVAELDPTHAGKASLLFSTYLGGGKDDVATGLALGSHSVGIAGYTTSPDFPTRHPAQAAWAGASSAFVATLAR